MCSRRRYGEKSRRQHWRLGDPRLLASPLSDEEAQASSGRWRDDVLRRFPMKVFVGVYPGTNRFRKIFHLSYEIPLDGKDIHRMVGSSLKEDNDGNNS